MRKIKCPICERTKRPYGLPRSDQPRKLQTHQKEYKIGTYEIKCDACGTMLFIRVDYCLDLAPIDIVELWSADGTPGEVIDEKRRTKLKEVGEIREVDPDSAPRPSKSPKRTIERK